MTEKQKLFLTKAMTEMLKYDQIKEQEGFTHDEMRKWWEELKDEREKIAKVRSIWRRKFKNGEFDFWEFYNWYFSTKRECCYCHITEDEIDTLIKNEKVFTKRLDTRGRSLEIERAMSEEPYSNLENLRYCCYWCNNAKTDTFTEEEFKPIGREIEKIWKNRLNK